MEVGVRALAQGYWGFASSPIWNGDEMARLGQGAAHQARQNALGGQPRAVDLAPVLKVPSGQWVMPVERDPFGVSPFEVQDFLRSLELVVSETPGATPRLPSAEFWTQEKLFASTEGSFCTQQLYRSAGSFYFLLELPGNGKRNIAGRSLTALSPAGLGWELFSADRIPQVRDHSVHEEIRRLLDDMKTDLSLPVKPVDVGRYDTVIDAASVQSLVAETLGRATEVDRALGYEANAGGTSYLNDPLHMIGNYQAGAPLLTLAGNRSTPGGAATVAWDDEGVAPDALILVKDGVLNDFQTMRESVGWLKEVYARIGKPFRSHGLANAPSAIDPPMQHVPNLSVNPGAHGAGFDDLVSGLSDGLAIEAAIPDMDFQHVTGLGSGRFYEVKRGKRTARISGAGFLFNAPDFWRSLVALGGATSVRRYGRSDAKGEPAQGCFYSVAAPAAAVKQLALIDRLRKA